MGHLPVSLQQTDLYGPSPPVILPIPRNPKTSNAPSGAVNKPSARNAGLLQKFAFPALADPSENQSQHQSPKALWPDPIDTETAQASAEIAEALLHLMPLDHPKVVAITSPADGDGKTSFILGLAPQLALRTSGEVLAVDANFHQPDLSSRITLPEIKTADPTSIIYPTNHARLNVMPAPHAGETVHWQKGSSGSRSILPQPGPPYLRSHQFWIEDLREGWSLTLLDMPSLAHAETAPLACCCDGVLLVVRLGRTARRAVAEASRLIRSSGSRLLGCVTVG